MKHSKDYIELKNKLKKDRKFIAGNMANVFISILIGSAVGIIIGIDTGVLVGLITYWGQKLSLDNDLREMK